MGFLNTYVKNHVWICCVKESFGCVTDNVVCLYDRKDQTSLANRMVDKQLGICYCVYANCEVRRRLLLPIN